LNVDIKIITEPEEELPSLQELWGRQFGAFAPVAAVLKAFLRLKGFDDVRSPAMP
jgi:hypothetical protein